VEEAWACRAGFVGGWRGDWCNGCHDEAPPVCPRLQSRGAWL